MNHLKSQTVWYACILSDRCFGQPSYCIKSFILWQIFLIIFSSTFQEVELDAPLRILCMHNLSTGWFYNLPSITWLVFIEKKFPSLFVYVKNYLMVLFMCRGAKLVVKIINFNYDALCELSRYCLYCCGQTYTYNTHKYFMLE